MRKLLCIGLLLVLLLTACQSVNSEELITVNQIKQAFEIENIALKETSETLTGIFGSRLENEKPLTFMLNEKLLLIYEFNSIEKRKKALEEFQKETESANTVSFKVYNVKNLLLIYIYMKMS
ncbi:hypothetical protein J27TS8_33280 [Robertmurraya siralis]|uniref:Lipoprotein n=1 Tax=Robertmurraya siralis TaxID=77777 RepID=A0A920BUK1_9BACI|nr:hypothetical protein [Robertmurraya siralis]GIN63335.1 hypothetical protein J27TS8_33280 [Robertmurraya siralis]